MSPNDRSRPSRWARGTCSSTSRSTARRSSWFGRRLVADQGGGAGDVLDRGVRSRERRSGRRCGVEVPLRRRGRAVGEGRCGRGRHAGMGQHRPGSRRAAAELARLFTVWDDTMLVRNDPPLPATPELVGEIQRRLAALGRYEGAARGEYDQATRTAIEEWAGWCNLEGRLRADDQISQHLMMELRDITPEVS